MDMQAVIIESYRITGEHIGSLACLVPKHDSDLAICEQLFGACNVHDIESHHPLWLQVIASNFRYLNRPSMSVGDQIRFLPTMRSHFRTYRCLSEGWRCTESGVEGDLG